MGNGLVTPRGHYGAASVGALSATGDVGILLHLLDQRRSIGLVEAAGLIGVSSRTMRRYVSLWGHSRTGRAVCRERPPRLITKRGEELR